MNRRQFLQVGAVIPAVGASRAALAQSLFAPRQAATWRTFEVTTKVEVKNAPQGITRAWLPVPSVNSGYQKVLDNNWSGNAASAKILHDEKQGADMLYAEWPAAAGQPVLELHSRVQTRDRAVDFAAKPATVEELSPQARKLYTSATQHMPLDGIVLVVEVLVGEVTQVKPSFEVFQGQESPGPVVAGIPDGEEDGLGGAACQSVQSIQLALT